MGAGYCCGVQSIRKRHVSTSETQIGGRRTMEEAMESRNLKVVGKTVLGALVAVLLTAGVGMAMAMDLSRSFAPGTGLSMAPLPRHGVVVVESGAYLLPELAQRPARKGMVLVESGAYLLPELAQRPVRKGVVLVESGAEFDPARATCTGSGAVLLAQCQQPAGAAKSL
jgi:hypothetical protein